VESFTRTREGRIEGSSGPPLRHGRRCVVISLARNSRLMRRDRPLPSALREPTEVDRELSIDNPSRRKASKTVAPNADV
jgi:hypothetical protein